MTRVVTFTEFDASREGRAALARFYEKLYIDQFPDSQERESLANITRYLALKERGWYGANNYHVLVMQMNGKAIGGAIFDYFARPNAGVIEFLFVQSDARRQGLGGALLEATERTLGRDARERAGKSLMAIAAEMNDPFRRPAVPDNVDPFERAGIWGKWGYMKIAFPYIQPALSSKQRPVDCLTLVAKFPSSVPRQSVQAHWVLGLTADYMRWAMRISRPSRNPQYRKMARFAATHERAQVIPLRSYVGMDRGLRIEDIDAGHPDVRRLMALLKREIPVSGRVASESEFRRALTKPGGHYHLWRVSQAQMRETLGMASFFTLPRAGFGGYIVLAGKLRGKGLLRPLIANIERRMIADATCAEGWFIECDRHSMPPFVASGFREVPLDYRPPSVGADTFPPARLRLLYKPYGNAQPYPRLARYFVLDCIADILRHVYDIAQPRSHDTYRLARNTWQQGT